MLPAIELMTATWAGDMVQFALLKASLARSGLSALRHHVVVQSEDLPAFQTRHDTRGWRSTADLLPPEVESARLRARDWQQRLGRRGVRWAGSVAQRTGWPRWAHYLGWQVQQISKLWMARESRADYLLILDSDEVATPRARPDAMVNSDRITCPSTPRDTVRGKTARWQAQAERLWQTDAPAPVDAYFDTPFPLHTDTVRAMTDALERRYRRPWWVVMLDQPPRVWSEFATYRRFLRLHHGEGAVEWRAPTHTRYLSDASDPERLKHQFEAGWWADDCHFITVHSPSSERRPWTAEDFVPLLMPFVVL